MNFVLKCLIPSCTDEKVIIKPVGPIFINGLSCQYDETYPQNLKNKIPDTVFFQSITNINILLMTYWPCKFAWYFGYILAIITFGLSLCIPWVCIRDAQEFLKNEIKRQNYEVYYPKGMKLELKKKWGISWIEITTQETEMTLIC